MKKKIIITILLLLLGIGLLTVYTTFAFDEEKDRLNDSEADYNLIYSLKEGSNKQIYLTQNEEKYIDITLTNTYNGTVKYGIYYYVINPNKLPDGVTIALADESIDALQDIVGADQSKSITLKITNNSEYNVELLVGSIVGFEKGNLEDLLKDGEVLVR